MWAQRVFGVLAQRRHEWEREKKSKPRRLLDACARALHERRHGRKRFDREK